MIYLQLICMKGESKCFLDTKSFIYNFDKQSPNIEQRGFFITFCNLVLWEVEQEMVVFGLVHKKFMNDPSFLCLRICDPKETLYFREPPRIYIMPPIM